MVLTNSIKPVLSFLFIAAMKLLLRSVWLRDARVCSRDCLEWVSKKNIIIKARALAWICWIALERSTLPDWLFQFEARWRVYRLKLLLLYQRMNYLGLHLKRSLVDVGGRTSQSKYEVLPSICYFTGTCSDFSCSRLILSIISSNIRSYRLLPWPVLIAASFPSCQSWWISQSILWGDCAYERAFPICYSASNILQLGVVYEGICWCWQSFQSASNFRREFDVIGEGEADDRPWTWGYCCEERSGQC